MTIINPTLSVNAVLCVEKILPNFILIQFEMTELLAFYRAMLAQSAVM